MDSINRLSSSLYAGVERPSAPGHCRRNVRAKAPTWVRRTPCQPPESWLCAIVTQSRDCGSTSQGSQFMLASSGAYSSSRRRCSNRLFHSTSSSLARSIYPHALFSKASSITGDQGWASLPKVLLKCMAEYLASCWASTLWSIRTNASKMVSAQGRWYPIRSRHSGHTLYRCGSPSLSDLPLPSCTIGPITQWDAACEALCHAC